MKTVLITATLLITTAIVIKKVRNKPYMKIQIANKKELYDLLDSTKMYADLLDASLKDLKNFKPTLW